MVKRWAPGVKTGTPITVQQAEQRALLALSHIDPIPANGVANKIWPDHSMRSQGAGGAASRVLKRLEKQGKARWTINAGRWGWIRL